MGTGIYCKILALFALICVVRADVEPSSRICSKLLKSFENEKFVNIFIDMKEGTASPLEKIRSGNFLSRNERLTSGAEFLQIHANNSQHNVKLFLDHLDMGLKYKSFWISNQIYIPMATLSLVNRLAQFEEISKIFEEPVVELEARTVSKDSNVRLTNAPRATQWGISKIQADRVWELVGGTTGEGIVVGAIDVGVRSTHQDLRDNFRSSYGWRDPVGESQVPYDDGFGTHTMGVLVGANGIGVAPGAQWIHCKGCGMFSCQTAHLLECGQFMACPTLSDGSSPDCTQAPDVVSNSWGGGSSSFFEPVLDAWASVGIVSFFAVGSSAGCSTIGSPASNSKVIGVGATTPDDSLSPSSSQGPFGGIIKPDVCAPGTNILSASADADDGYVTLSGSSMACHHAAGTGALILSARKLPYEEFKTALMNNCDTTGLTGPGTNCGGIPETEFPNNAFGYGRINAYESVLSVISSKK